jgi:hypothetical protein
MTNQEKLMLVATSRNQLEALLPDIDGPNPDIAENLILGMVLDQLQNLQTYYGTLYSIDVSLAGESEKCLTYSEREKRPNDN